MTDQTVAQTAEPVFVANDAAPIHPPTPTLTDRMKLALKALELAGGPFLEKSHEDPNLWYVVDGNKADHEVNHPGELIAGPIPFDDAHVFLKVARAEALLGLLDMYDRPRWSPIADAPRDGTSIHVLYEDGTEEAGVEWAATRQCMLGSRAGERGPGWISTEIGGLPVGDSCGPLITHYRL
jgi:hypothetical protein